MLSVAGGKLTTYRRIALDVLEELRSDLGLHEIDRRPGRCRAPRASTGSACPSRFPPNPLPPPRALRLAVAAVLSPAVDDPGLLEPITPDAPDIAAQVVYAAATSGRGPSRTSFDAGRRSLCAARLGPLREKRSKNSSVSTSPSRPRRRDLRLHHRRRGLSRLRPGEPFDRRRWHPRAGVRGRPARPALGSVHPDAGSPDVADRQPVLRLEVSLGARGLVERTPTTTLAEVARRIEQHQRNDLPARQSPRLRTVGDRTWARALGLRPLLALLQAHGDLPRGSRRIPRSARTDRP